MISSINHYSTSAEQHSPNEEKETISIQQIISKIKLYCIRNKLDIHSSSWLPNSLVQQAMKSLRSLGHIYSLTALSNIPISHLLFLLSECKDEVKVGTLITVSQDFLRINLDMAFIVVCSEKYITNWVLNLF
jgi:hypothetical protein